MPSHADTSECRWIELGEGFVLRRPHNPADPLEILAGYRVNPDYVRGINDGTRNAPVKPSAITLTLERPDGKTAKVRFPQCVSYAAQRLINHGGGATVNIPTAHTLRHLDGDACNVYVGRYSDNAGVRILF